MLSARSPSSEPAQPGQVEDGDSTVTGLDQAAVLERLQRGVGARAAGAEHQREVALGHAHRHLHEAAQVARQRVAEQAARDALGQRRDGVVAQGEQREPQPAREQRRDVLPQQRALVQHLEQLGGREHGEVGGAERARLGGERRAPHRGGEAEVAARAEHRVDVFLYPRRLGADAHRAAEDDPQAVVVLVAARCVLGMAQALQAPERGQPVEIRRGELLEMRAAGERAADASELTAPEHGRNRPPGNILRHFSRRLFRGAQTLRAGVHEGYII